MFSFFRRLQRKELLAAEFPAEYRQLLVENVPLYRALSEDEREKLEGLVKILLAEKRFAGVGGLELSEEMCVAIAARACLLVLHRVELDAPLYPRLGSILVYPNTYRVKTKRHDGYVVTEGEELRLGESWDRGTLVLSWNAVVAGAANSHDGHDVVLHEFAHQLDGQDGAMDGSPELPSRARYQRWAKTLGEEFEQLTNALEAGRRTDIDPYAATNPPEFFAVVTEEFFEQPDLLWRRHQALYKELAAYYKLDPLILQRSLKAGGSSRSEPGSSE